MAYTISINEEQRVLIHSALEYLIQANIAQEPEEQEELTILESMFHGLPAAEQEMQALGHKPGISIHGFAL